MVLGADGDEHPRQGLLQLLPLVNNWRVRTGNTATMISSCKVGHTYSLFLESFTPLLAAKTVIN